MDILQPHQETEPLCSRARRVFTETLGKSPDLSLTADNSACAPLRHKGLGPACVRPLRGDAGLGLPVGEMGAYEDRLAPRPDPGGALPAPSTAPALGIYLYTDTGQGRLFPRRHVLPPPLPTRVLGNADGAALGAVRKGWVASPPVTPPPSRGHGDCCPPLFTWSRGRRKPPPGTVRAAPRCCAHGLCH